MRTIVLAALFLACPGFAQTNPPLTGPLAATNAAGGAVPSGQGQVPAFCLATPGYAAPNYGPVLVLNASSADPAAGVGQIRSEAGGAVADHGASVAHFALNANTVGALSVQPRAGGVPPLRAHAIGLCYWSLPTGQSVMLSQIQDSTGQILPPGRVLYRGALGGDHDLLYAYGEDSVEQFVVLHKRLPKPEDVLQGADRIQVWVGVISELVDPPEPRRVAHPVDMSGLLPPSSADLLPGEEIYFGAMHILGEGKAFVLGSNGPEVPTATAWYTQAGENGQVMRSFVIDFVPYRLLQAQIDALPEGALQARFQTHKSLRAMLARTRPPKAGTLPGPGMLLAKAGAEPGPGVAIDYTIVTTRLLNVNFGSGTKTGYAAVGQTNSDYWNLGSFAGASTAVLTNLAWSDTNASTVGIIVSNAPGVASNSLTTDPMYSSYVMPTNGGSISLTITNLPANTYHLYLYGHGTNPLSSSLLYLSRAGTSLATKYTTQWSPNWRSTNWEPGIQYVVFKSVSVTNQSLQVTVSPGGDGTAYLNGLQIVASSGVPPPSLSISNLININFGADAGYKSGFAATGLSATDFWNGTMPRANVGTIIGLTNSSGTATGVGLLLLGTPGVWNNSIPDNMYANYCYASGGNNASVTLTNLPAGSYDFYCYGHSASDADNTYFQLWAGERAADVRPTTMLGSGWNSTNWDEGQQYIVFRDIEVKTNEPVLIEIAHSSINYATINGLQVVFKGSADTNGNGLADAWEMLHFGNLTNTASGDPDGDFISNAREYQLGFDPTVPNTNWNAGEIVWVEDSVPVGATLASSGDSWTWTNSWANNGVAVTPYSGSLMHVSSLNSGTHEHYFYYPDSNLRINTNDAMICYINLDAANVPGEVMLQWYAMETNGSASWEHRAYWGANSITSWGTDGTVSRTNAGALPAAGQWVCLQVPASAVGLEGRVIQGVRFTLYGGRAAWDRAGKLITNVDDSGLPDGWQIQYFGHLGVDPQADPDGDGYTNLQEYQNGTSPTVYNSQNGLSAGKGLQVFTPLK